MHLMKEKTSMRRKLFLCNLVFCCVFATSISPLHAAYVYHLEAFTNNGSYYDSGDLDLYVVVSDPEPGQVDFTFHNQSLIDSSIARIYFDDDSLLSFYDITGGSGTLFSQPATPGNLPGGNTLEPSFVTTDEFCFKGGPPAPQNGINPTEQLTVIFNISPGTFSDVLDGLDTGALRIGAHVIALPDGSSESAVTIPEPATVALLGMGALCLLRKRRNKAKN
jgi:hypothetical protein